MGVEEIALYQVGGGRRFSAGATGHLGERREGGASGGMVLGKRMDARDTEWVTRG